MYVLGTAGHVDHGKSTLIKELTGIDPDRLKEEKDRQMTIDLGFAWYQFPSGVEVGIIDVPGHRDFIENMLAGVGGIDAVLLVIAADEGIMPQTREHLNILKLLKIKRGLIVLTKTDLVTDEEWLDLVEVDVRALTKNTFLEDAPVVRVSAYTKAGMDELISDIEEMLKECPPKRNIGKARLPIDRVFSIKGFGTVVTGTLLDGELRAGQTVELLPLKREARIRGIQNHKKKLEVGLPGNRTAINLTGLDVEEIKRGDVLTLPGRFRPSKRVDAKVEMLEGVSAPLAHDDEMKVFVGASQTIARVRVLGKDVIPPGDWGWIQLELKEAVVVEKGDHFILRRPSPGETIAGGVILDVRPPKRHKRFSEDTLVRLNLLESGSTQEILLSKLETNSPIRFDRFLEGTGLDKNVAQAEIENMTGQEIIRLGTGKDRDDMLMTRGFWSTMTEKFHDLVTAYHQKYPLRNRMALSEINQVLKLETKIFSLFIKGWVANGVVGERNGGVAIAGYTIKFSGTQIEETKQVLREFEVTPFTPPALSDLKTKYDADLLGAMLEMGMLVKISDDIAYLPEPYSRMKSETLAYLIKEKKITVAQFRDLFQTSRKYALAFLEHLDAQGVTRRSEDYRTMNPG